MSEIEDKLLKLRMDTMNILAQFRKEEIGNRLSQFSMNGLNMAISQLFEDAVKTKKNKQEKPL